MIHTSVRKLICDVG